jgi:hypothetical protein
MYNTSLNINTLIYKSAWICVRSYVVSGAKSQMLRLFILTALPGGIMIRHKCPYCKRPVRVRRDGKLSRHPREQTSDKSIRQWPNAAYPGNVCPGSEEAIKIDASGDEAKSNIEEREGKSIAWPNDWRQQIAGDDETKKIND